MMQDATLELIDPVTGETIAQTDVASVMAPKVVGRYSDAEPVRKLADWLIREESNFMRLRNAKVSYLFRNDEWVSKGYTVYAKTFIMDDRQKFNTGLDVQIVVNKWVWDRIDDRQREALIAHELCHIDLVNGNYSAAPHDLEEFRYIAKRYGAWDDGLQKFLAAFQAGEADRQQPTLFEGSSNEN